MQWWGDNRLRAMAGALCAVTVVCHGTPAAAAILPNLSSGSSQDAQEAADLADAHSDLSVQRALSAMPVKAAGDKAAASEPRATASQGASPSALQKPATPASASASAPRTPGETLQKTAKDLAVDAKQLLSTEFGSDKTADPNAEGNVLRRRTNGETSAEENPHSTPRSAEQSHLDEEQASFLASALVREVTPWAVGAALLLACAQGVRALLAYGRRKAERKRRHRKSSGSRNARR